MQRDPTDQLDIKMTQANRPFGCFADCRKRFGQDFLQRFLLSLELLFFIQAFDVAHELSNAIPELIRFAA